MSQDSNGNLFNGHPHFQASPFDPNLYPDMSMQFAASVPHRPQQTQPQNHLSMNFGPGGTGASFHNPEVMMQPHSNSTVSYYGSPYERPEPPMNSQGKQQHQSNAERRAEHNAIERLRRENLNVKFQQLAFALPNLQNDTRPSKSTIIDRTLDFVKGAILKEDRMQYRIQELEKFNRYLLAELDKKNGTKSSISPPISAQEEPVEQAISTAKEETPSPIIKSSPTNSVISDDSYSKEIRSLSPPPQPPQQKQSRKSHKRRSVSHSSVSMIPKLEYNPSTNWPTSITTSPTIAASNQHMILEQSNFHHMQQFQHQDIMSQQQQKMHPTISNKEFMFNNAQSMFNFNMNPAPYMNNHLQLQHRH